MSTQHKNLEAQSRLDSDSKDCFSNLSSVDIEKSDRLDRTSLAKLNDTHERQLIRRGFLPDTRINQHDGTSSDLSNSSALLISKSSSNEQKLRAIEKLVGHGITYLTAVDANGKSVEMRLEVERVGNRRMVHMFAVDDCGKEKTVLRGISKGDHYEAERDQCGHFVSYEGKGAILLANARAITPSSKIQGEVATNDNSRAVTESERLAPRAVKSEASAQGTAYYPFNDALEGGCKDKRGKDLCTLQSYLKGESSYVSVAMDKSVPYGSKLCIPELNAKYGRNIDFRVVDTGGAFVGKGTSRIDICVANASAANDDVINGQLTLQFV